MSSLPASEPAPPRVLTLPTSTPAVLAPQTLPASTLTPQIPAGTITAASPLPDAILTTPRLLIRPMHPLDAPKMVEYAAPRSIAKFMSLAFPHPYTLQHAETWISLNLSSPFNNFSITERNSPEVFIGGIGLKPGGDVSAHTADVGYWVGENFAGKGYVTEALEALTKWFFENGLDDGKGGRKELKRLTAAVYSGHEASMRCLEKCGFVEEGVLKDHVEKWGETYDLHLFGLRKGDWEEWRRKKEGETHTA